MQKTRPIRLALAVLALGVSAPAASAQFVHRDVVFSGQLVYGQDPFAEPGCANLLPSVGDLNGDGLADLGFLPSHADVLAVARSTGRWAWSEAEVVHDFGTGVEVVDALPADLDLDGDADIVYAARTPASFVVGVLLSENGQYTAAEPMPFPGRSPSSSTNCDRPTKTLVVADVTRDGIPDVVHGYLDAFLLVGVGDGTFSAVESIGESETGVAVVERSPGPRAEIAVGAGRGVHVYKYFVYGSPQPPPSNGGNPAAAPDPEPYPLPPRWLLVDEIPATSSDIRQIERADLNGDALEDLVVLSEDPTPVVPIIRGQDGSDTLGAPLGLSHTSSMAIGDFNADGVRDIASLGAINAFSDPVVEIALGLGTGAFDRLGLSGVTPRSALILSAVDLDLDGDDDLLASDARGVVPLESRPNSNENLIQSQWEFEHSDSIESGSERGLSRIVTGDFTSDGLVDIVVVSRFGEARLFINQPTGTFVDGVSIEFSGSGPRPLATDIDGDGHLDLAVGLRGLPKIAFGQGDGTFEPPLTIAPPDPIGFQGSRLTMAFADFDSDGLPDLVTADAQTTYLFLQEPQTRAFADAIVVAPGACSVTTADMDGDSHPDIVAAYGGDSLGCPDDVGADSWIAFSDGAGGIREVRSSPDLGPLDSVKVGDENADGNADVLGGLYGADWVRVARGDGNGGFSTTEQIDLPINDPQYTVPHWASRIEVADLNGDAAPDISVRPDLNSLDSFGPPAANVFVVLGGNAGTPRRVFTVAVPKDGDHLRDFALADLDQDGSPEIITPRLYLNGMFGPPVTLGVVITPGLVRPSDRCPADLAEPAGLLDLADLTAFAGAFLAGDAAADLAPTYGTFDLADLVTFVSEFLDGCE